MTTPVKVGFPLNINLLIAIYKVPEDIRIGKYVSRILGVSEASYYSNLALLEKEGLVERRKFGRRSIPFLTKRGEKAAELFNQITELLG